MVVIDGMYRCGVIEDVRTERDISASEAPGAYGRSVLLYGF
jgi:hypothetical protein